MKKLILSLFAIATVFVACNKESVEIDPITSELEEINVITPNIDKLAEAFDFINSLNDQINSGDIEVSPKGSKGVSSAKAGDFGGNWIQILFFDYTIAAALGERDYAYVRSDNYSVMCADISEDASSSWDDVMILPSEVSYSLRPHPTQFLLDRGFSQLIIETIDASGTTSSTTNVQTTGWSATFNADFDRVFAALSDRSGIAGGIAPQASRFDTTCVAGSPEPEWGESPTTPGLFLLENVGSYTLAPAPFPLTGFLATMSSNDTSHTVSNYAGTSTSTVHDAIRDDYAGN